MWVIYRGLLWEHTPSSLSDGAQRVPFGSPQTCLLAPVLLPEHFWWSCTTKGVSFQSKSYQTIIPRNRIAALH